MDRAIFTDAKTNKEYRPVSGRWIRRYVGGMTPPIVKKIDISRVGDGEGMLSILWEDGNTYQERWPSFDLLVETVRWWRNLYGSPLSINGVDCEQVRSTNPALTDTTNGSD